MTGEVIGDGFVARYVRRHLVPGGPVTVLAAGVSSTSATAPEQFAREAALVTETARRCRERNRLLVHLSSASCGLYGRRGEGREDARVTPPTPYGRHKLAMERVVSDSGAPWLTLRLSHLVGPGQNPAQLIPSLAAQIRSGTVVVHRGARRDLLDVRHFVTVLDRLLALGVRGQIVNVASGFSFSAEEIVTALELGLGQRAHRILRDVPAESLRISNRRMRAFVPETEHFGFGAGYLDRLVARYVPHLAAAERTGA
ncbi:NAD-dependent epimerase/dehydratase family protein [Streptomyces cyanogenus]|uniref:NAD dependent epimerase/dehydratase family protein n=1 Tax=Streptomyces cyanogenus TaxID=80860 RepID=A0ABX7U1W3_STRCY|nr:NAD-dependent epimerase/dehydratase family protein [Streptomyces cyanogenus]QTE03023.1 NAD dependent epimerase/dehydratase family protein [Streptomyces cyanogenus]